MRSEYRPELEMQVDGVGTALVNAIADDIERGRLRPNERIPGSRTLASRTGLHRSTVVRALEELVAEGWLETETGRGTFVSSSFPSRAAEMGKAKTQPHEVGFPLSSTKVSAENSSLFPLDSFSPRSQLWMTGGLPDLRLVPAVSLSRAIRRALSRHGKTLLGYGNPLGDLELRRAVARWIAQHRGVVVQEESVMITRGAQMAFALFADAALGPGDRVAVESFGYRPAWRALTRTGATLVPVDVDEDGIVVEDLEQLLPLRAIYVTPHHQYPTGATLSAPRRDALLAFARRHQVAILEDDYDHEVHYDGRPVPPVTTRDEAGVAVYIGTFSKAFAPGVRTGFVIAPPLLLERMALARLDIDRQGDLVTERAMAELIGEGEIDRHTRRVTRVYRGRRDTLVRALTERLPEVTFEIPRGGMALWMRTRPGIDPVRWQKSCLDAGLAVGAGREYAFAPRGRVPFIRMGFAVANEEEIARAVEILRSTLAASQ